MIDAPRVLRPLSEAGDAIDSLVTYSRPRELAEAVKATWTAVERSLRLLLRSDTAVPDEHRLAALSSEQLPLPNLLEALRQRNLVSMELAGRVHELAQAADRAAHGDVRASDADVGRQAVAELRREVTAAADSPIQEVAHHAVETGAVQEAPQAVPAARGSRRPPLIPILIVLVIAGAIIGLVYWLTHRGGSDADAVAAFKEGRLGVAEQQFRSTVQDHPDDVLALLYLARIYRREGRFASADTMLGQAVRYAPDDPDVRRERGHLLMAAGQPSRAATEYERAVQAAPKEKLNWIGWVQALRASNDPRVGDVIRRAPPDAQAFLTAPTGMPSPTGTAPGSGASPGNIP